jgi:hypothetical protein
MLFLLDSSSTIDRPMHVVFLEIYIFPRAAVVDDTVRS